MNWTKRIVITLLLSIAITFGLSALPHLGQDGGRLFSSVFLPKAVALNDKNVVDVIGKMQLHLRVRKVDLNRSILSIDLSSNAAAAKDDVLRDFYEIPQYMFEQTTNINQVFVRVMDTGADSSRKSGAVLLAALDARRDNWMPGDKTAPASTYELAQFVESHYRVTYTSKWKDRFEGQDGYMR
ncbi:hypothetical protein [Paenibacillus hamazuiensis]|uniref:hypothetical protein n=1 Tax=Paenibacillus hamazuiensis TaxID=2936508 RepID=UPI00200BF68B|nr:hypothetical protein [Paenibacillus hamazuiensis]